jgi:NADPH:quinone reductase
VIAAGIGLPDVLMCRHTCPLTPSGTFTPGQEVSGVVSAVGPDVDMALGAMVMSTTSFMEGNGPFAEECLAPAQSLFSVPPGLADADAAGFWIPHLTGWIGLVYRARLEPGQSLVVLGASGGSGIAAV